MPAIEVPLPPLELRQLVGPSDPDAFDTPCGFAIYTQFGVSADHYDSVFDFGCGCGRIARQLLLQQPRPRSYVGIDIHKGMIDWCRQNLTPVDPAFQFFHHDVYSPGFAPQNHLRLSEDFPVGDESISLAIAHSVFTHLTKPQVEFYLGELARVLRPDGIAFTSWFFFDRDSFPFLLEGPYCLYTSETDFAQAVIFDRRWFIDTLRRVGLRVRNTRPPGVPGHQWIVLIERRTTNAADEFPLGEEAAEWLCGAPVKSRMVPPPRSESAEDPYRPPPPDLYGALALLEAMKRSRTWRIGRAITAPWRLLHRLLGRPYDDVHGHG